MLGTPWILRYRTSGENATGADDQQERPRREKRNPHRPYAGLAVAARRYGRIPAATQGASGN